MFENNWLTSQRFWNIQPITSNNVNPIIRSIPWKSGLDRMGPHYFYVSKKAVKKDNHSDETKEMKNRAPPHPSAFSLIRTPPGTIAINQNQKLEPFTASIWIKYFRFGFWTIFYNKKNEISIKRFIDQCLCVKKIRFPTFSPLG